jgi:hypothetical protein
MTLVEVHESAINSRIPLARDVKLTSSLVEASQLLNDHFDCANCPAACSMIPKRRPTGNEVMWAKFNMDMLSNGDVGVTCHAKSAPSTAAMTKNCEGKSTITIFID